MPSYPERFMCGVWVALEDVHEDAGPLVYYCFDHCSYFTPMHSDPYYGSIAFRRLTDITSGREMPNQCGGYRVADAFIDKVQYHIKDSTMRG